jgi:hypothetical protein
MFGNGWGHTHWGRDDFTGGQVKRHEEDILPAEWNCQISKVFTWEN